MRRASLFKGPPPRCVDHLGHTSILWVVVCDPACCSTLDSFDRIYVGALYRGDILYLGPYYCVKAAWRMPLCLVWIFLRMNPKVRFAFMVTYCICWFQVRSWPISSPRYFAWSTGSKTWPRRTKWVWRGFRARVICRTWHLLGLKCLLPLFNFLKVLLQGLGIIFAGDGQVSVSSSKSLTCELMFSGRSFMYRRNKIGLRTEPWGTPEVTRTSDDFCPSKATHCERPNKNALMQLSSYSSYPMLVKFEE